MSTLYSKNNEPGAYKAAKNLNSSGNKYTILVVEDDEDILNLITRILESNNFNVHGFYQPEAALEHVRGGCKEGIMILSDVQMPMIGGPKLVEKIKQIRPEMKVMMMSSYSLNKADFGQLMPSTIVDDFIQKPFNIQELILKINSLCS